MGAGIRVFGNYGASGDRQFSFGFLSEAFVSGEYGLPIADKTEAMFGAHGGMAMLLPGKEFQAEIHRLREQGVSVWSVPRLGWLGGISVGARRRCAEHILLRGGRVRTARAALPLRHVPGGEGARLRQDVEHLGAANRPHARY